MAETRFGGLFEAAENGPEFDNTPAGPGEYTCEVNTATFKTSQSGNEMISVRMTVSVGPNSGKSFFNNTVLTEKAAYFAVRDLRAFGLSAELLDSLTNEEISDRLVGRNVIAVVKAGEYNGKVTDEIDELRPADNADTVPPVADASDEPVPSGDVPPPFTG